MYNVDNSKTRNIKNSRFLTEQYFNKKQNVNNSSINNLTKRHTINNTEDVLNVKDCPYNTYISNNYKSQIAYVENNRHKRYDNRVYNNTNNIYKHVNQYSTDVLNNCKINKTHNVKKTYVKFTNDVVINKHNTININDTYHVTKMNKLVYLYDNN